MALSPVDSTHALQIQAGTLGRKTGHAFEDALAREINTFKYPLSANTKIAGHVHTGNPSMALLTYVARYRSKSKVEHASAISTGALATSEEGKRWLTINGASVSRCKSDLVLTIAYSDGHSETIGVSTKQCNNKNPTNAQLYFTTARGFASLLRNNGLRFSERATNSLRQFCGEPGFQPLDLLAPKTNRLTDPRRYFWEEIEPVGRLEMEALFGKSQDLITRLLLQKAYMDDPFVPDFLLHKTKKANSWASTELALFHIDEIIRLSTGYQGFATRDYSVRKGSHKDPAGVTHKAPRFGIVQMQRGGQKQHPDQLQFNLEAGYFYKI